MAAFLLKPLSLVALLCLAVFLSAADTSQTKTTGCGKIEPECAAYARLLSPLAKTRDAWLAAGGINDEHAQALKDRAESGSGMYVAIREGEVYVHMNKKGFQTRLFAGMMLLHRALTRLPARFASLPNLEFVLLHRDKSVAGSPFMSWCRPKDDELTWLYPDFSYYNWPEIEMPPYLAIRKRVAALVATLPFKAREKKLFWRGGAHQGVPCPVRTALLAKLENRSDIADVKAIPPIRVIRRNHSAGSMYTPLWEFCRHKYIIYTEGVSASGRLKFHLLCGSVLVSHPRQWDTPETLTMEEGKNVVTVRDDEWSDVEQVYQRLEQDASLAEKIAAENRKYYQLLSADGISCYALELLKCYSEAMAYTPLFNDSILVHLETFVLRNLGRKGADLSAAGDKDEEDEDGEGKGVEVDDGNGARR